MILDLIFSLHLIEFATTTFRYNLFCIEIHYFVEFVLGKNQFHKMPYSKSKKKGFKNSNFAIDKSVCNKFRTPYKPFVQTNHDPPAGNIHKPQKSLNSFYLNRQLENKQHPYLLYHENIQNLDLKNSNPLPMQQDSFHISNQKYSEVIPFFFP